MTTHLAEAHALVAVLVLDVPCRERRVHEPKRLPPDRLVYAHVCVHVCMCVRARVRVSVRVKFTDRNTLRQRAWSGGWQTRARACVRRRLPLCLSVHLSVCLCACMRRSPQMGPKGISPSKTPDDRVTCEHDVCVRACVRACVCVCVRACVRAVVESCMSMTRWGGRGIRGSRQGGRGGVFGKHTRVLCTRKHAISNLT